MFVCVFPGCDGHQAELAALLHGQAHLAAMLAAVLNKEGKIMTAQDDIQAAISTDTALIQDLTTQTAAVAAAQALFQQEIEALEAQGVDTSGLVAANAQLSAAQAPLDAAVAALTAAAQPPAPPADNSGDGSTPPADGTGDGTEAPADDTAAA